jgi:hypothetical protein
MQLDQPLALLALLSLPAIVALFSLRPRRRDVVLSTTSLWREALRERQRGLGLQRLLRNLSLALLLLAALALSVGLADPRRLTRAGAQADTVVVLDASASMQARAGGGGGTRFALARQEAADLIDELGSGARMLLMTSGRYPVLRSAFESDRAALRKVLSELRPTDEAGRPRAALTLALSLLRDRDNGRVVFLTDAAFDADVNLGGARIELRNVGGPGRNLAITRFDLRPEVGSEDRFQVLLTVRNYTGEPVEVPAAVELNRNRLFERRMRVPPGGRRTLVLPFRGKAAGRARASIDFDDDLAADNEAFAVMGMDEPLRVLLLTEGNFYLESLFKAMPNVEVVTRSEVRPERLRRHASRYDLIVFDRLPAPALPPGSYLLIDTLPPGLPITQAGRVTRPLIVGRGTSAIMRDVDLAGVKIDEASRVSIERETPGLQRLFWSAETELALALLQDDVRLVYLGFDLSRSNLPLQAAFPLLVRRSLSWLRPRETRFTSTQIPAGEPFSIDVPANQADVIVRTPAGDGLIFELGGAPLEFEATSEAGIYRYTAGAVHRYIAVNLTDEDESNINARASLVSAEPSPALAPEESQVALAFWPYLAGLALLALGLEWVVWCTRPSRA